MSFEQNGSVVTANGSPVTATDFRAHNGILHIIDRVMVGIYERGGTIVKELHRYVFSMAINVIILFSPFSYENKYCMLSVKELNFVLAPFMILIFFTDSSCPVFKTLGKLVGLAGLCETLNEKGPFTLMAPSDT